jgi:hypothetical protein
LPQDIAQIGQRTTKHRARLLQPCDSAPCPNRIASELAASGEHPSRRMRRHFFFRLPSRRLPSEPTTLTSFVPCANSKARCAVSFARSRNGTLLSFVLRPSCSASGD